MTVRIGDYQRVVFFTGAGMSAESGVPTFRGAGGIWKEYDFERYACQEAFDRAPEDVWEFHNYRRTLVAGCDPNQGHQLIAHCQERLPEVTIVTQNIDGLHQRAGASEVLELHGSLWRSRCQRCPWTAVELAAPLNEVHCPDCAAAGRQSYKRPGVVWFGDHLRADVIEEVESRLARCDLLVSIGTSAVVYPAAEMPLIARRAGAHLIEVNPEPTEMSASFHTVMRTTATQALAELCAGLMN